MFRCMIVFPGIVLFVAFSTGCRSFELCPDEITGQNRYNDGKAFLYLRNEIQPDSRATGYFWGVMHMGLAERNFNELFSRYAGKRLNLNVTDISDFAGREETPPDGADLLEVARDSGGDFLFVGTIQRWHQSYIFLLQWSRIRFSMTCYSLKNGEMLWMVDSRMRKFYATSRRVLIESLEEMFEELTMAAVSCD